MPLGSLGVLVKLLGHFMAKMTSTIDKAKRFLELSDNTLPGPWLNEYLFEVSFEREEEFSGDNEKFAQVCRIDTQHEFGDDINESTTQLICLAKNDAPDLVRKLLAAVDVLEQFRCNKVADEFLRSLE